MQNDTYLLVITAISIGFFHTLLGPDHYIPFIVISRARKWTGLKTTFITVLCGIGHVGSSILLGIIGLSLGLAVNNLVEIESLRGEIAAWMLIAFGFVYLIWGIKRSIKFKKHSHVHFHSNGEVHSHTHTHSNEHSHFHEKKDYKELTPWILFTIFVLGPCEPFIPILLYPAASGNMINVVYVTIAFTLSTVGTMVLVVSLSLKGFSFLPRLNVERYMHPIAGATIMLCGIGMVFLGL